jgi:hypothetical protein
MKNNLARMGKLGRHKPWAPSFGPLGLGGGTAQDIGYVKERYPEEAQNCALGVAFHSGRPFARIALHSE